MKVKYKLIFAVPLVALTMGACKTYMTTVVAVYDNNKILVKDEANDERLIDCSKKGGKNQQVSQDLPYFANGDQLKIKQRNPLKNYNYDGRRVFGDDSNLEYNNLPYPNPLESLSK